MCQANNPSPKEANTTTEKKHSRRLAEVKALLADDQDLMKSLGGGPSGSSRCRDDGFLGADRSERVLGRTAYRTGYYSRGLVTRIGPVAIVVSIDVEYGMARMYMALTELGIITLWFSKIAMRPWIGLGNLIVVGNDFIAKVYRQDR